MPTPRRAIALAATLLVPLLASPAAAAPPTAAFRSCGSQQPGRTQCARVAVPLDRTDASAGEVRLAVRRTQAGRRRFAARPEAVLFLAGGPGEATTSSHAAVLAPLAPLLRGRDLLTVDTRGTGRSSDLIVCPELASPTDLRDRSSLASCARRLGPAADRYGTADVVADLDQVRAAAGYERLLVVGVSYGTYTAQRYAAAHPDRVSGLLLDSPVDGAGDDPFGLASARAAGELLVRACRGGACAGVTRDPRGDLVRLQARLPVRAAIDGGRGRRVPTTIGGDALLQLSSLGDVDPLLRAPLPGAIRRAAEGDPAPLVRLARETGLLDGPDDDGDPTAAAGSAGRLSLGTLMAVACRDTAFPWTTATAVGEPRLAAARAALDARPAGDRGGWSPDALIAAGMAGSCAWWPTGPDPAAAVGPLPTVPTLILSGREDQRTPTAAAERLAARIPGARLLVAPGAGHSLLLADRPCVRGAVARFATGGAPPRCSALPAPPASPLPPASARELGRSPRARGQAVAQRTVDDAVTVTFQRILRELDLTQLLSDDEQAPVSFRIAGLRSGYLRVTDARLLLRRLGYVPGTAVTGALGGRKTAVVEVRGRGLRPGRYRVRNPLGDPRRLLELLGLDPDQLEQLSDGATRAIERLAGRR
ncbi:alpha/beta fold hydrolase [Patulibacter defluvii]|uniref:alpha/beta fold hydrolase n=2 Tax=Bacteria TaxID=2 RepID=UPI002A74F54E|nr:alpha/beta fold hydrolase [Patulibacter sp. DM4]